MRKLENMQKKSSFPFAFFQDEKLHKALNCNQIVRVWCLLANYEMNTHAKVELFGMRDGVIEFIEFVYD